MKGANLMKSSVANPDPGSGAFFTWIRVPGRKKFGSGIRGGKIRIRIPDPQRCSEIDPKNKLRVHFVYV
jgi:hypothetical protein